MSDFSKRLPKVELHAHLTGSISRQSLHEIWQRKKLAGELTGDADAQDPLKAIPPAANGVNIKTFFPIFDNVIYNLITTAEDIRSTTRGVLDAFAADGVVYLELRTTPRANTTAALGKEAYVRLVLNVINAHNASQPRLRTRLILTIDRRSSPSDADEVVDIALRLQGQGIVGIDLAGNPLAGDVRSFTGAFARARDAGLGITVHFGETVQSGRDEELYALLEMKPRRLGHVIHLSEGVSREVQRRKLGLELCLSCNVLAEMTEGGFRGHHFSTWRDKTCPTALSTDDVGIFESELSNEFDMVMEHLGVSRRGALELSKQAANVIFGEQDDKKRILKLLDEFEVTEEA